MDVQVPNYKTAIVRDIFVFCCFTGLAYADIQKLSHDDIHTDGRGDMWIIDNRAKTGTQFRIKLLPVARSLVERYSRLRLPDNKVFPVKDCDSMNMPLRHVARHVGLSFKPTMHQRRHTFATTVTLSQGVPLETVSKMLGHKHITTTQICQYATANGCTSVPFTNSRHRAYTRPANPVPPRDAFLLSILSTMTSPFG